MNNLASEAKYRPKSTAAARIPVFVLTGFLGSGKTTLLSGLLKHEGMANTAVVVNEIGEIGIDHFLVTSSDENVVLLNSGCLCCTLLNTLAETLLDLLGRRERGEIPSFERVVIETTGLADPGPIVQSLLSSFSLSKHFKLHGIITVVDAVFALSQFELHAEVAKQVAVADRIVLTKTDIAEPTAIAELHAKLARICPGVPVQEITFGAVADPKVLIGATSQAVPEQAEEVASWLKEQAFAGGSDRRPDAASSQHHGHSLDHAHDHHDRRLATFSLYLEEPTSWAGYACWTDLMRQVTSGRLLRMKGLLNVVDSQQPVVVHAVQHVFYRPTLLDRWPTGDQRSRLVFITWDLDRKLIEQTLVALKVPAGSDVRISLKDIVRG